MQATTYQTKNLAWHMFVSKLYGVEAGKAFLKSSLEHNWFIRSSSHDFEKVLLLTHEQSCDLKDWIDTSWHYNMQRWSVDKCLSIFGRSVADDGCGCNDEELQKLRTLGFKGRSLVLFVDCVLKGSEIQQISHTMSSHFMTEIDMPVIEKILRWINNYAIESVEAELLTRLSKNTDSEKLISVAKVRKLLQSTHITKPKESVLKRMATQFPARLVCVYDADSALELYNTVKYFPGETTKVHIATELGIKLNGPFDPT